MLFNYNMVKVICETDVIESGHGMDAWFMGDIKKWKARLLYKFFFTRLTRKGTEVCQFLF